MSPPARIARDLAAARRAGAPFEAAWLLALERALHDDALTAPARAQWRVALDATRGDWEAAWHRHAAPGRVLAVALLAHSGEPELVLTGSHAPPSARLAA